MKKVELPADIKDGLATIAEPDGRINFVLVRRGKPLAGLVLPAQEAGQVAAQALAGAFEVFDREAKGLVTPVGEGKSHFPFVRVTGLGLGPCPIEGFACLVVRVGRAELGLALPREKLKEFAQWLATTEPPEA